MGKRYDVPVLAQSMDMDCWNTSASMIWAYWQGVTGRQGPMYTLGDILEADNGLEYTKYLALGERAGLKAVKNRPSSYSSKALEELLIKSGPLWCAGSFYYPAHMIVLTGIVGDQIFFNDPDGGREKTENLNWFNTHLFNKYYEGCLMYKDPDAY
jgi:hypothetical protein